MNDAVDRALIIFLLTTGIALLLLCTTFSVALIGEMAGAWDVLK